MIKKVLILWLGVFALSVGCKKDCITYIDYAVPSFKFSSNGQNIGLFTTDIRNNGDTIRSIRNQFYFSPDKDYLAHVIQLSSFSLINSAYAKDDCAELERSVTTFNPLKTEFSVDAPIDLSALGLAGVIPAGTNLLTIQELRDAFLFDIQNNAELHFGIGIPISVNNDFLKYFNGQTRTFRLQLTTPTGNVLNSSAIVVLDINA